MKQKTYEPIDYAAIDAFVRETQHTFKDEMVCPYCLHPDTDSYEYEPDNGIATCGDCGKEFRYDRATTITYTTSKLGD